MQLSSDAFILPLFVFYNRGKARDLAIAFVRLSSHYFASIRLSATPKALVPMVTVKTADEDSFDIWTNLSEFAPARQGRCQIGFRGEKRTLK